MSSIIFWRNPIIWCVMKNADKKLPIELQFFDAECERNSLDYVEAIRNLFQANPDDAVKCLMGKCEKTSADDKRDKKRHSGNEL